MVVVWFKKMGINLKINAFFKVVKVGKTELMFRKGEKFEIFHIV